jgi:hypothetical protein
MHARKIYFIKHKSYLNRQQNPKYKAQKDLTMQYQGRPMEQLILNVCHLTHVLFDTISMSN